MSEDRFHSYVMYRITNDAETRVCRLTASPVLIGRAEDCDVSLHDPRVSSYHALVTFRPAGCLVFDLVTTYGTYINGNRIVRPTVWEPGNVLRICSACFVMRRVPRTVQSTHSAAHSRKALRRASRRDAVIIKSGLRDWLRRHAEGGSSCDSADEASGSVGLRR